MGHSFSSCEGTSACTGAHCASTGTGVPKRACRLRIIAINDVYKLDNMARFKTLIDQESVGFPKHNVVTTLAGDFLGPSLLSSLDGGRGMIRVLNQLPMDFVCFGNHETDVAYQKLVHRIAEFHGNWLNANMPTFEPKLPPYTVLELVGNDEKPCARTVAFTGFCIGGGKFASCYRDGAFGGAAAQMVPVIDAAKDVWSLLHKSHPDLDDVIPITHQDMPEDIELANTGLFPVIVAGHDHEVINEVNGPRGSPIVKAGMDADNAAIIDLEWSAHEEAKAKVKVALKQVKDYAADPELAARIEDINQPVRELELATLYELKPNESLTSVGAKFHDSSMARKVATAIRGCLECDCAVINSGAVRGNKEYTDSISYGDLQKECPYPSVMLVVPMPFDVLRDAIKWSRKPWWGIEPGAQPKEGTSALQIDEGMKVNENHVLVRICDEEPPSENTMYAVACDSRVLKKNEVFKEYCGKFPERIPPEDAGRPVLPILVEFFCGEIWEQLVESAAETVKAEHVEGSKLHAVFEMIDADHDGNINEAELQASITERLGKKLSSKIIVKQMMAMIDKDADNQVSEKEFRLGVMKVLHHHASPEIKEEFEASLSLSSFGAKANNNNRLNVRKNTEA